MLRLPDEAEVLARFRAWAEREAPIRALVLTSSRARADESVDPLSDYDLIVAVGDAAAFAAAADDWTRAHGEPMVRWSDEHELHGLRGYFRGVVYADGVKVDYMIWPLELLDRIAAEPLPAVLDVGYRVLLDKDGRTASWPPPSLRAHVPARPSETEYRALVEEFWWGTTYAAKALWRGELAFAKFVLDYDVKLVTFGRMLDWRIELDHDWTLRPGKLGRGLERLLPADLWRALAATYAAIEPGENWEALRRLCDLFRRVAVDVGDALGFDYPDEVDAAVRAYLDEIRAL